MPIFIGGGETPIHRSYSATRASSLIDFRLLKEEWFTVEHTFQRAEK